MIGSNPAADFYAPIFYLWQTGIGGVIGFFVGRVQSARQTPRQPILPDRIVAPSPRRLSLASMIFFLSIVGVFSFYIVRNIATEHTAAVRQNRIASAMASAPSARNLPPIVAIPMGDALVLHEISGSTPVLPSSRPMYPSTLSEPPTFDYSVGYQKMPMTSPLDYHPLVSIAITQYPNPEWARYQLKDVPVPNAAFYYEKYIQKVTKFGRVIYENTAWRYPDGRGHIYEYWASGPYIVIVTFRGPIDDEFLRPYLAKYPSTP